MVWKRGVPKHMVWKQRLALNEIGKINQKDKQTTTDTASTNWPLERRVRGRSQKLENIEKKRRQTIYILNFTSCDPQHGIYPEIVSDILPYFLFFILFCHSIWHWAFRLLVGLSDCHLINWPDRPGFKFSEVPYSVTFPGFWSVNFLV